MRLIDADEVLKRWGLKFYAMGGDRLGPNGEEINFYVNGLLNEIQNAPTVERPQGEWIIDGHHYKCSRCGKTLAIMFSETDDDDLIGCPFCLADMRGGRE